jgi:Ricin-type beta-trefoil lectin domain
MKRPASLALVVSLFAGLSLVTEARSQTLIVSGKTGKCLDVPDANKATHAIIQQSQCDGGLSQRWFFRNGTIVNQNSGLCLDIPGGYESDHTPLQQYPCHGGPNQLWTIGTNGEIKSVATRKCLDIPDGLSDDHLFVQQFQCSGGPDQAWSIRSVTFNTASPSPSSSGSTVEFGTDMEPGRWFVSGTMNGAPLGSLSRCFSYGNVREMMTTGEGIVDSSCPVGLERHGNEFRGSSQCALTEASARIVLESSVHLTGDLSLTLNGKPLLAEHVEARRTGPC